MNKKIYSPRFKFGVVLESLETNNVAAVSRKHSINANMVSMWRKQFRENGSLVFENTVSKELQDLRSKIAKLEQIIGKKEVELSLMKNFFDFHNSKNG